jgi:RHS repeat-associated protein
MKMQETHYYPFGMALGGQSYQNPLQNTLNRFLYNGKELQGELGLQWYEYGFRMYDPVLGRFPSVDPAAERYSSISPYAYCANNPIIYIDPTGMYIEEGSQKEWDRQKGNVTSQRDYLQNRVDKLTAKAEAKGWSSEKLASRIGDKTERIGSLNTSLGTMGTLESSSQGYSLSNTAAGENGGVTLNTGTNTIDIKFGSSNTGNFVHEVTHAGQFETGNMAFDSKSGMTLAQDIHDEVSAYKAQYAYDPSTVSGLTSTSYANSFGAITTSWVQGLAGGTLYAPGGTANTGIGPLNINSTRTDFINAYPSNPAMKTLPASFILKTSYPNIYYKK